MGGLSELRVVELAGGVGVAYAAKLLADLGADVVRVEAPDDPVRRRPFDVQRWLNTNKRSQVEPLGATGWRERLLPGADLVIHDGTHPGADPEQLLARHLSLVVGTVSPYGATGPWAGRPATELTVMHASSWAFLSPAASTEPDLPPLTAPGHHGTLLTATIAATAFLAAVDAAQRTGLGEHVDFSSFASGAKMCETSPVTAAFLGENASRIGVRTLVPWSIYQCRDGLIQFICVEDSQWRSLKALMGEPEWAQLDLFDANAGRQDNADLIELYLGEWMAEQSAAELFVEGQARRLCLCPVYRMDELAHDRQLAARGFFSADPDGVTLPGPGFQVDQPWWALRASAPAAGQHDGEGWREAPGEDVEAETGGVGRLASAPDMAPLDSAVGRPLEGIQVCDFTWIWAGPYCTQLLAHLGADVVRIESPEHLCLLRRLPFHPPGFEASPDTNGMFQIYNSDKRSIALDLGADASRQVVERLIARSDVVIDNFAVGTLASLGYSVEAIRALNPNAIVVSLTGFGQNGPYADYMGYGPCGGAFAGLYAANGYEEGRAMETGIAIGDPATGLTGAWAVVAALVARRHHGVAARIDVAMVEAISATVGELWMQYQATGASPRPIGNHDPQWAPHNVYRTGHDEWLALACTTDHEFRALVGSAPDLVARQLGESRFVTGVGRKTNEVELDDILAGWFDGADRSALLAALLNAGVPASASLSPLELWGGDNAHHGNEQLAAIGMLEQPDHAVTGRHVVPGIPWRFRNRPNGIRWPAPALGQHTDEVLAELGFDRDEIDRLAAGGAFPGRVVAGS
jgi:crotonobetainyl-CoA:carnitine CoA-transferase CaiB-like acyl-CoA transferase